MVMHICNNCNYRFEGENPIECPNCRKKDIEKEMSAEELLEDVKKILEDG